MKLPFHREPLIDQADMIRSKEPLKVMHSEDNCIELLAGRLQNALQYVIPEQPLVLICVGTDRSTGDALGPLVGSNLRKQDIPGLHLYGTLDYPVHAMNLNETLNTVHQHFKSPFIIAIDACLGQLTSVGCIQIGNGPLKPGAGVNKDLPPVGNLHVTGIVNVGGFMEYFVLQNTRLSLVMKMSEVIAKSFQTALTGLRQAPSSIPYAKIE